MAKGFKHGAGGGASLNFKVAGNPQPASPKENTIWVDTDEKITGWHFSATQPENMANGEVWFPVGTSSNAEFNALKKNGITVCPMSAKQYINGALVDKTAKCYQAGTWNELLDSGYLLYGSNQCESVTGGWVVPNGSIGSQGLVMDAPNSATKYKAYPNNAINFSGYSELVFEVTRAYNYKSGGYTYLHFQVENAQGSVLASNNSPVTGTVKIDVSGINTTAYLRIYCSNTSYVTIKKIYLE